MEKKKTSTTVLLIIMGVLILAELASRICIIKTFTLSGVLVLISLAFTALYGFFLYKKPHGNMLKYAMLIFAVANIISQCTFMISYAYYDDVITIISCAAICYGAGRLNRIEQNRVLFPIIDLVFLVRSVMSLITVSASNVFRIIAFFSLPVTFTTLMIAYFVRYKEHKEAGLMDAPKK